MAGKPVTFFDANVLLEIILGRQHQKLARDYLENSDNRAISDLSAHLIVHFGQAVVDIPVLRQFLVDYTILSLEATDFAWAFTNARNKDFEDALQLAVAIRNGCDHFITLDKSLYSTYRSLPHISIQLIRPESRNYHPSFSSWYPSSTRV